VAAIFAGGALGRANQALAQLARQRDPDLSSMPPQLQDYFRRPPALPGWADPAKMAQAQRLFRDHDREVAIAFLGSSLPQDYAFANASAARVPGYTPGAMARELRRLVFQTTQFVYDVFGEGGLAPGGAGSGA
jgi:hypothetical protein